MCDQKLLISTEAKKLASYQKSFKLLNNISELMIVSRKAKKKWPLSGLFTRKIAHKIANTLAKLP